MEINSALKNEICVRSLGKNQEQQGWVWGCFCSFLPQARDI